MGIFTAATSNKTGTVTAKYNSQINDTAQISVISKPDSISIRNQTNGQAVSNLSVSAGESIDFNAQAVFNKMPLVAQDHCFTWEVKGDIGSIDANGVFTPAKIPFGTGTITASAGGTSASVTVSVVSQGQRIENFEGANHVLQNMPNQGLMISLNKDLTKVRYGYQSAAIQYDFTAAGTNTIALPTTITFAKSPDSLSFWVYGDGSKNTLNLIFQTPEGAKEVIGTTLDFTGWKMIVVSPPKATTAFSAIANSSYWK
jgi:hypothetical protein